MAALHADGTRWWVALLAGMRQGERLGATLDSIDFERHEFRVQWSLTEVRFRHGCGGTCGRTRGGACPKRKLMMVDHLDSRPLDGRPTPLRPQWRKARPLPSNP